MSALRNEFNERFSVKNDVQVDLVLGLALLNMLRSVDIKIHLYLWYLAATIVQRDSQECFEVVINEYMSNV